MNARSITMIGVLLVAGCGDGETSQPSSPASPAGPGGLTGGPAPVNPAGRVPTPRPSVGEGAAEDDTPPADEMPSSFAGAVLASVDAEGRPALADSSASRGAASNAGRFVVFDSAASGLAPGDPDVIRDVFLRDTVLGSTELVSRGETGGETRDASFDGVINADGRFVAFASLARDLARVPDGSALDIFVRDRLAGRTVLVSRAAVRDAADGPSFAPRLSADGRFVAFASSATNLVAADVNGVTDVFVRDLLLGVTERASVGAGSRELSAPSEHPALSSGGRFVVFVSSAPELVAGRDENGSATDVFMRDRSLATTELVSRGIDGVQGSGPSGGSGMQDVSADGRVIVFASRAGLLALDVPAGQSHIFARDRTAGTLVLVSVADRTTIPADGESTECAISADGRFVVFVSNARNLVPDDLNGAEDIFVHDLATRRTARVSVGPHGVETPAGSTFARPGISPEGAVITFVTRTALADGSPPSVSGVWAAPNPLLE